jgi:hypothetical protein
MRLADYIYRRRDRLDEGERNVFVYNSIRGRKLSVFQPRMVFSVRFADNDAIQGILDSQLRARFCQHSGSRRAVYNVQSGLIRDTSIQDLRLRLYGDKRLVFGVVLTDLSRRLLWQILTIQREKTPSFRRLQDGRDTYDIQLRRLARAYYRPPVRPNPFF